MAYLSTIKDGSSNDILVNTVSDSINLVITTDAIDKLISQHKDAFIHSD